MKQFIVALVVATAASAAQADPSLHGTWKSDRDMTMKFNKERAILEDRTVIFLEQMMGRLTLTFTAKSITSEMPSYLSQSVAGVASKMIGFKETHSYRLLGSTRNEVAVKAVEPVTGNQRITVFHFEDENTMWVYAGGENFPTLNIREYFVRIQ